MLTRAHRLNLSADIRRVLRRGRRFVLPEAVVHVLTTPGPTKLGVITPKVVGNSVVRHSVARKIRHSFRPVLAELPTGFELVVRAQAGADTLSVEQWTDACQRAISKARAQSS